MNYPEFPIPKFLVIQTPLRGPSEYHRYNVVPSGMEGEVIKNDICLASLEVQQLDTDITLLWQHLDRLQRQRYFSQSSSEEQHLTTEIIQHCSQNLHNLEHNRYVLYQFIEQEQSLFAPIRKLPTEILRQIFHLAHANFNDGWDSPTSNLRGWGFPRIATQVSHHWREVAQSDPSLWSDIWFMPLRTKTWNGNYLLKCIELSKPMPLNFKIHSGCFEHPEIVSEKSVVALGECAHRWGDVSFTSDNILVAIDTNIPGDASFTLLRSLSFRQISHSWTVKPAPNLQKLSVENSFRQYYTSDTGPRPIVSFQHAPSLTMVCLNETDYPMKTLRGLPWAQITHLEMKRVNFSEDELHNVLLNMTKLYSLTYRRGRGPNPSPGSITLQCLEILKVDNALLDAIIAPQLRVLHVREDTLKPTSLLNLVRRSGCSLEELSLSKIHDLETWRAPEFNSIKLFKLETPLHGKLTQNDARLLTRTFGDVVNDAFPKLEMVHLSTFGRGKYEDIRVTKALIEMLKSRILHDSRLEGRSLLKTVDIMIDLKGLLVEVPGLWKDFLNSDGMQNSDTMISFYSVHGKVDFSASCGGSYLLKSF